MCMCWNLKPERKGWKRAAKMFKVRRDGYFPFVTGTRDNFTVHRYVVQHDRPRVLIFRMRSPIEPPPVIHRAWSMLRLKSRISTREVWLTEWTFTIVQHCDPFWATHPPSRYTCLRCMLALLSAQRYQFASRRRQASVPLQSLAASRLLFVAATMGLVKWLNSKGWDVDDIFTYDTPKIVRVRDHRLGLLSLTFQVSRPLAAEDPLLLLLAYVQQGSISTKGELALMSLSQLAIFVYVIIDALILSKGYLQTEQIQC